MTTRDRIARGVTRVAGWIRDGWLMAGIALLMLVGLELAYRGQAALRRGGRAAVPMGSPYADSAWYPAYLREYEGTFRMHWQPYVYFRRHPFAGTLITVDSSGHRRTIPGPRAAQDTIRVFFFGGSTMWGTDQRDEATIASVTARRLAGSAPPGVTFAVTNYGESGYVATQEMLELELQLRAGNVPDVAVFFDGINDVAAAAQMGEPGLPQNEFNRYREFEFGRAVYGSETGVGSDWRAARAIGGAIAQRLQLIQRVLAAARPFSARQTPDELARGVARTYVRTADIVEALSRTLGFRALYVWQPSLGTTTKRLTPYEEGLLSASEKDGFQQQLLAVHRLVAPMVDSAMRRRVGPRFVNQASMFAGDTSSVFMDQIGHNTEKSIPAIVDGFFPILKALTDSARVPRPRR